MRLGIVGLGRMGANMAERLRRNGHEIVGYDRDPGASEVGSLAELVEHLEPPRAVWSMVPAGGPTRATVEGLAALLEPGDLLVEGANSNYHDTLRHAEVLREAGVGLVDAGVSGGIWGLEEGYCLMVGGSGEDVERLRPIFDALRPSEGGFAHVGPVGTGHFTKMVHNGIEYGLLQAYGEGYELLHRADLDIDVPAALDAWRHGSVVRSWLLDLLVRAVEEDPGLERIAGYVDDSGEGRWTVQEAVRLGVAVPAISASLYARFVSRQEDAPAMQAIAALRRGFGGHEVKES